MAVKVASLYAELGVDDTKLKDGLKNAKTGLKGAADGFKELTGVSIGATAAIAGVASFLGDSVRAAIEAEKADANLNATLASTKFAAGLSADEVKRLSLSLAEMSGQDDEAIQNANAMLLTFTKIGKDVFPDASTAMVNMAAKFGSLDAASVQLGKALNDPIGGVTALRRVGVMLTDQQEESIKKFMAMNNIAGAQKVILGELETEFGGLAAAMGQTLEGKVKRLDIAFGNLKETIGAKLIPVLGDAVEGLNLLLTKDQKTIDVLQQHEKEMRGAASYTEEMARAAKVAGYEVNASGDLVKKTTMAYGGYSGVMEDVIVKGFTLSATEQKMQQDLKDTRAAAEWTAAGFDEFDFAVSESDATMGGWSETAKTEVIPVADQLTGTYGKLTQSMIFNQLAFGMDKDAAMALGVAMGVLDPVVIAAKDRLDSFSESTVEGARNTKYYAQQAEALAAAIAKLQDKTITITTYYNNAGQRSDNLVDPRGPAGPGSGPGQSNAPQAVSSNSTVVNFNGYSGNPQQIAAEIARQQQLAGLK